MCELFKIEDEFSVEYIVDELWWVSSFSSLLFPRCEVLYDDGKDSGTLGKCVDFEGRVSNLSIPSDDDTFVASTPGRVMILLSTSPPERADFHASFPPSSFFPPSVDEPNDDIDTGG
jgi:hypothetical protein